MKDKNGKDIIVGHSCIVDDTELGIVNNIFMNTIGVLMLKEEQSYCYEQEVLPTQIDMK